MMRHRRAFITLGLVGMTVLVFAWASLGSWILAQRPEHVPGPTRGLSQYQTQEAIDAVQNTRLSTLDSVTEMHSIILVELQADRNWLMGGLAMIGGVFVIVQIMQIVQLKKKL